MPTSRRTLLKNSAAAAAALSLDWTRAQAQAETVRIGTIFDLSGLFVVAGSVPSAIGTQIAIDLVNERGGVGGKYKVQSVNADSQSKADAAINELEVPHQPGEGRDRGRRLRSARRAARRQDAGAEEDPLDHHGGGVVGGEGPQPDLHLPRPDPLRPVRQAAAGFLADNAKAKLGAEPKDIKIAVIHEDGPYGVGVGEAGERFAKEKGFQVVMREGYSAAAPDLSSLVTKLERARPTSSCIRATTPTSRCSCARRANPVCASRC